MKKIPLILLCFVLSFSFVAYDVGASYTPVYGHYMATKEKEATGQVYASLIRRGQTSIFDYNISVDEDIYEDVLIPYACTVSIDVDSADSSSCYECVLDIDYDYAGDSDYIIFNPEYNTHIHIFISIVFDESEYCYCTYDYYWGYDASIGGMGFTNMTYTVDEYEG